MGSANLLVLRCSFLCAMAAAWSCNDAGATELLEPVSLAAVDEQAVCNDGSSASYYFKDNGNHKLWLVYLSGGGWCYDAQSCTARHNGSDYPHHDCSSSSISSPCFMSSKDFPPSCGKTGIFDTQKSPLRNANKVYVPYCSSDAWMGDGAFNGWDFRGARIARAVIHDLRSKGLNPGSTLVFGGGSAGGRGAMVLLDEVANSLPGVKVLGFLDSPFYIDVDSFSPKFGGFQQQHVGVLNNFNASSVVSDACRKDHPGNETWKCLFGQYRMPYVATSNLMMAAQFDAWQLSHLVHGYTGIETNPKFTEDELAYIKAFGKQTLEQIRSLHRESRVTTIHSTGCYNHHISEKFDFWNVTTSSGVSEARALAQCQVEEEALYLDQCSGYNCGTGCSSGLDHLSNLLLV